MRTIEVAVVGGGQAGLAISRCLSARGIEHLVLERGEIAERWSTRTWDSLRLLTPNWLNTLPGMPYEGDEPEGFMRCGTFAARLRDYAAASRAPVFTHVEVKSVERHRCGFLLQTSAGAWVARATVVATGHCDIPYLPGTAEALLPHVVSVHASQYRSPAALPRGRILVVGASASGVQIADELQSQGRDVILAVSRHTRLPRTWRGRDIHRLLHQTGMLSQRTRDLASPEAALREPAPQLAGRTDRADVNLATLQARGVRLTGRLVASEDGVIGFGDNLGASVTEADAKQKRVLQQIDASLGLSCSEAGQEIAKVNLSRPAATRLSVKDEGVSTIVWAMGYRRDFRWLKLLVHKMDGELAHRDGVTSVPGLYALGLRLLRKRDSHFVGGVGSDAEAISDEISAFLGRRCRSAA
jgi:putative flavoprotein involved in K+ transport